MNTSTQRRLFLFRARLLRAAGLASLTVPLFYGTACTSEVIVQDGEETGGGGGTGGTSITSSSSSTSSSTTTTTTGVGGSGGAGGNTSTSVSVGPSTTTGVGGGPPGYACWSYVPEEGCPSVDDAGPTYGWCTEDTFEYVDQWVSGPYVDAGTGYCCYEVVTQGPCGVGRPLMVEERAQVAQPRVGATSWAGQGQPRDCTLTDAQRAAVAAAWTRDGLYEHASIASFGRFALELMALGAPADLVAAAHQAALDEVEHAKLCFAIASRFGDEPVGAGPLDAARDLAIRADLVQLAVATFEEGCVGETLAALMASEQRDRAADPQIRAALEVIAEDEARHAELAWQTVRWAIAEGGDEVREAIARCVQTAREHAPEVADQDGSLADHGLLATGELRALQRRALLDVVLPCAQALVERA